MNLLLIIAIYSALQQPIDGTQLSFIVEKDAVTVQVGRWKLRSTKAIEMNRFVDLHIKEIDPNKIVIYGEGNAKYKSFQSVIEVMKRHDWMRFKLEDTNPTHKPAAQKVDTKQT